MATNEEPNYGVKVDVRGMTCASCSTRVQTALAKLPGVSDATVNYATDMALIRFADAASADYDAITEAIEDAGYDVAGIRGADEEQTGARSSIADRRDEEARAWKRRWIVGLILTVPIMLLQMGPHWIDFHPVGGALVAQMVGLIVLTGAVMLVVGRPYFVGAWRGLEHRSANMDTLVALGSGVAFVYSTIVAVIAIVASTTPEVFFDGAAMILTLISVGKFLEARAKGRAGAELEALLDLAAKTATVRRGDDWVAVPAEMVQPGDVMLVKPGEKIPTDGVVVAGSAAVDEAMLTGESVPATRTVDDEVVGGTINTDGRLEVRATKIGSETALAQIAQLVARAQESKAEAQRLADRVSAIFVPAIIVIAAITFVGWLIYAGTIAAAVLPAVAVLIVACPCALGLATPTAIMVGTGRAAQRGIVIRDAQALEQVRRLDTIVFDKTGTLTRGQMTVTDVVPVGEMEPSEVLRLAASLESGSEHPIARAIVQRATEDAVVVNDPADFASEAGHGVTGTIDERRVRVGKPGWLGCVDEAAALEAHGKTVVGIEIDGTLAAIIAVRDELKPDAAEVVAALRGRGVEVWMITGDNATTAAALAAEAGIDPKCVRAGVAPENKAAAIEELKAGGRVVAMVGDGVNDAPALATADLGIALGSGTDVAMQSADITLVGESLARVLDAITISEATNRKIKQNLFWAFCYNTVLVPVAALGFLVPMFAAAAMALSSVSVVSNSLLLRRVLR